MATPAWSTGMRSVSGLVKLSCGGCLMASRVSLNARSSCSW